MLRDLKKLLASKSKPKRRIPKVRKGQGSVALNKTEFERRFLARFYDPEFAKAEESLKSLVEMGWNIYRQYRKAPRTRKAGSGWADPKYELSLEWLETHRNIQLAEKRQRDPESRSRILLICGSSRSDQTCPGEISKTFRLAQMAKRVFEAAPSFEVDFLDLSRLTSEYGRVIYPCKACVSTAMPLCHWPCSCYPNHALGQVNDWMSEIYPRWTAAHGVMIVTPVHWYQAPSVLKLMIDRLVCADGGNPDPTSTSGKDPKKAKALELKGWPYPRHLAGRAFSVVVHGDADGVGALRKALTSWLSDMKLIEAAPGGTLGRYVGYYQPYAESHEALDKDIDFQKEVRHAARSLVQMVKIIRQGKYRAADQGLEETRPK
jgi:multimeric flavodoxin WrbA